MNQYDAIVIGAGQAGPSLAAGLANRGERVAIIEGYKVGGSCVNYGCIPSKTLIASARAIHMARRGDTFGFSAGSVKVDFAKVMARKAERVESSRSGLEDWLEGAGNLDLIRAWATFEGSKGGQYQVRAGDEELAAPRVYINTGARPTIPPIDGLERVPYLDNEGLLNLKELPQHLIVLGGGYIGLEFAQAFRRFGSKVTVVEHGPHVAGREDEDIAAAIEDFLRAEDITVLTGHRAMSAARDNSGRISLTAQAEDGSQTVVTGSHLLVAVGRQPNSDRLNLQSVRVDTDRRGYIVTDEHLKTTARGIWALGDVNGRGAFTHTSYNEYEIVMDNINGGDRKVTDRHMAYNLYTDPPLGRVGMSENEARQSGRDFLMAIKPMSHISRALEQAETNGMIKLLVDAGTKQIVGAAVLGFHGDDVIQAISYYMATGATYVPMMHALPIHPTISEFLPTILGELKPLAEFDPPERRI
jgi:pyruvate/2-oxoglutarate dehydrogenase complex dihydrolipoamide dehydrogenase (E3) component